MKSVVTSVALTLIALLILSSSYAASISYSPVEYPDITPRVRRYDGFIQQLNAIEKERQTALTKKRLLEDRYLADSSVNPIGGSDCAARVFLLANPFSAVERAAAWFQGRSALHEARRKQIEAQEAIDRADRVIDEHLRNWLLKNDPEYKGLQSLGQNLDGASGEVFQLLGLLEQRGRGRSLKSLDLGLSRSRLHFEQVDALLGAVGLSTDFQLVREFNSVLKEVSDLQESSLNTPSPVVKNLGGIHRLLRSIRRAVESRMNEKVADLRHTMAALRQ